MATTIENTIAYPVPVAGLVPDMAFWASNMNKSTTPDSPIVMGVDDLGDAYYQIAQLEDYYYAVFSRIGTETTSGFVYLDISCPVAGKKVRVSSGTTSASELLEMPTTRQTMVIPVTSFTSDQKGLLSITTIGVKIYGMRLTLGTDTSDDLGVFSGDTADTEDYAFSWAGEPYLSKSIATSTALIDVEAAPVVFDDSLLSYTVPNVEGVAYSKDSVTLTPGPYTAAWEEVVTITAAAMPGYKLTGQSTWSHTYPAPPPPTDAEAAPVVFDDSLLSYTVPNVEGVAYSKDSVILTPGQHTAAYGEVVTITAAAKPGYSLTGQSTWSHTYPFEPMAERLMRVLGHDPEDEEDLAAARDIASSIHLMVKAYTRGRGFVDGVPSGDLDAVMFTAGLRYLANPSGLTFRSGTESVTDAFKGWTLAESFVLNSYRKRAS